MLESAKTRALPLVNKGVDLTPAVNTCCGVCRTCTTTNAIAFGTAILSWGTVRIGRLLRRPKLAKPQ